MHQIYCNGQRVEVSERAFWDLVKGITEVLTDTIAHTLHSGVGGFPGDIGGDFINLAWVKTEHDNIHNILPEIIDKELVVLLHSVDQKIQEMYGLNEDLVNAIAAYLNMPTPQTKQDYQKLSRKMNRSGGPIWYNDPRFQQVAQQMKLAYQTTQEIKQQINQKVSEQLSKLESGSTESEYVYNVLEEPEETETSFGEVEVDVSDTVLDQLAEELIDEEEKLATFQQVEDLLDIGDGESDPKRAIQIFHLALRYQPTPPHASSAYMGIGMKYEVLGDRQKAIENYTKAIEIDSSNARLFLWRGEQYLQLGEQAKARSDFEQALSISPGRPELGGLFGDERETAERYLAELNIPPEKN